MYNRILIPSDGSELAAKGIDHGLALAKALNIPATIVTVVVPLTGFALQGVIQGEALDSYNDGIQAEVNELEALVKEKAAKAGVAIEFITETNVSPAAAILEVAQSKGCGLIVISSHGRRGIGRLLLGSQTSEVLANSTIPVLVVR
jgi:nucleotide-binding universal stress UspA family protein